MTAMAQRRARRTIVGATVAMGLVIAAAAMFTVGVITLSNSQEGEAVGVDSRPRVKLPATPNAMLAVTDDDGELASVVVLTLLPDGQGGSVVVVPVDADTTAGFGLQRRPLDEAFDPTDAAALTDAVEGTLSITIERTEIVDPAGLAELLAPIGSVQVVLPDAVVDPNEVDASGSTSPSTSAPSTTDDAPVEGDPGVVVSAGPQILDTDGIVDVLTSIDDATSPTVSYEIDVAMWTALGQTAPLAASLESPPTDAEGNPVPPATVAELLTRLWEGEVGVRDLASIEPGEETNPTASNVLILDRPDVNLVFAQLSPGLVSTPNLGLKTRILVQYTDAQLDVDGEARGSNADIARGAIGQLLFLKGNIVSVDTTAAGAPDITMIEVADPQWVEQARDAADLLYGPSEVSVATTVIEGVDVQVVLGLSYLQRSLDPGAGAVTTTETGTVAPDG